MTDTRPTSRRSAENAKNRIDFRLQGRRSAGTCDFDRYADSIETRVWRLVKVRSSSGIEGIGFCYVGSADGEPLRVAVEGCSRQFSSENDSCAAKGLRQRAYQEALLQGGAGTVMRAITIRSTALWDLNARTDRLPHHMNLGAVALDTEPAYASDGYYLECKTPQMHGNKVASYVEMGFKAVKMKAGRLSRSEDRPACEAVGPDVALMIDINNGWRDVTETRQYVCRFEQYHPHLIGKPFSPDEVDHHGRLLKLAPVPIETGEIGYHVGSLRTSRQGCREILQTDGQ